MSKSTGAGIRMIDSIHKVFAVMCPSCNGNEVVSNGFTKSKKRIYRCKICGKQFVENPCRRRINEDTWAMVDSLLRDGVKISIIQRATSISKRHLYSRRESIGLNA